MKNFFSKCGRFRRKLWTWSHLRKKSLTRNFIFCEVLILQVIQNMIDIKEGFVQWFAKIFITNLVEREQKVKINQINNKLINYASLESFKYLK